MVKSIINLIQELNELMSGITLYDFIKLVDVDIYNSHLILLIVEALFVGVFLSVSHQRRYQDVQNRLKLQELPHFAVTIYKLSLLLQLLDVDVA